MEKGETSSAQHILFQAAAISHVHRNNCPELIIGEGKVVMRGKSGQPRMRSEGRGGDLKKIKIKSRTVSVIRSWVQFRVRISKKKKKKDYLKNQHAVCCGSKLPKKRKWGLVLSHGIRMNNQWSLGKKTCFLMLALNRGWIAVISVFQSHLSILPLFSATLSILLLSFLWGTRIGTDLKSCSEKPQKKTRRKTWIEKNWFFPLSLSSGVKRCCADVGQ